MGEEYTVADIICYPWVRGLYTGYKHASGITAYDFLSIEKYTHVKRWVDLIGDREAVKRGVTVNGFAGPPKPWLAPPTAT